MAVTSVYVGSDESYVIYSFNSSSEANVFNEYVCCLDKLRLLCAKTGCVSGCPNSVVVVLRHPNEDYKEPSRQYGNSVITSLAASMSKL